MPDDHKRLMVRLRGVRAKARLEGRLLHGWRRVVWAPLGLMCEALFRLAERLNSPEDR